MFGDSLIISSGTRKHTQKWLTLPISLLLHGLLIAAIVVVPLMMADTNLPQIKVTNVFVMSPPPPPPPRRGSRTS